ncbi:hypothetical protein [Shimia sp. Alg240-R146]|uniref:hypothetical protein n=2 Tax=unclassified Shimia TaxID=2630038 RepID=UPI0022E091B8|nr:hypothetical protein [Shimia sp. Alg240-R146]
MPSTKAINLRIEHEYEQLVRDAFARIRNGGPGFRKALRALIDDENAAAYVPAHEVHARFGELERLVHKASIDGGAGVMPEHIEEKMHALEAQMQAALEDANDRFVAAPEVLSRFARIEKRLGMAGEESEAYIPAKELDDRFATIEASIGAREGDSLEQFLPATEIRAMFGEIEQRLRKLEGA